MRISDWSSDGCSSDLKLDGASGHQGGIHFHKHGTARGRATEAGLEQRPAEEIEIASFCATHRRQQRESGDIGVALCRDELDAAVEKFLFGVEHIEDVARADAVLGTNALERELVSSEEHTSELQSLMRISYAVFCLKTKKHKIITLTT